MVQRKDKCVSLNILRYKQLQSTNTTAYRLGERGSPDWTVVVAEMQTKGRGRRGKKWESPKGGLWFSILFRPEIPTSRLPIMQFLAANATRQALEDEAKIRVQLKWPNDIVVPMGKLGGILVESKTQGEKIQFVVVGIGLNIKQPTSFLPAGATSLRAMGVRLERLKLLRTIIHEIKSRYDQLADPSRIIQEWWCNCVHRPLMVQVASLEGLVTGITTGIEQDGSLMVEAEGHKVHLVSDGTLRVLEDLAT